MLAMCGSSATKDKFWGVKDSNLRRRSRQIYSLLPLTARETPLIWWNAHYTEFRTMVKLVPLGIPIAICRIRTDDPEITSHVLWPAELRWHGSIGAEYYILGRLVSIVEDQNGGIRTSEWRA